MENPVTTYPYKRRRTGHHPRLTVSMDLSPPDLATRRAKRSGHSWA
uniref:Uncharacterized protein n=1 Tax=Tarenaya spinosa TaxID=228870 RepID=Q1KUZ3_9ROSI|nr:hypothetical protein [Tarenaya spinosa]